MTTKRTERTERIKKHGLQLLAIFPNALEKSPIALCKKLRRLENKARHAAIALCDVLNYQAQAEAVFDSVASKLRHLLSDGAPIIINRDPRGYALKICDEWVSKNPGINIHRDVGGYGIIAPEID